MRTNALLALFVLFTQTWMACGKADLHGPAESSPRQGRRQAILILLDAARADRFGYAGYERQTTPHMDALAATGMSFQSHFSQETSTRTSLPSLIYSRYFCLPVFPASDQVPLADPEVLMHRMDDEAISLPRTLQLAGFETAAITAHSWIRSGTTIGREFHELEDLSAIYHPRLPPKGEVVVEHAMRWIADHIDEDYFLYLHFMDTHFPHELGPDARRFYGDGEYHGRPFAGGGIDLATLDAALTGDERRYVDALYDGSLRYVDRQLGRLFAFLEQRGVLRNTLIVITADHGEYLGEVPHRFSHGGPWFDPVSHIPLIVSYPREVEPTRVEGLTGHVDVFPSMISLLHVALPPGKHLDGVDLSRAENQSAARVLSRHGVRTLRHKLILADQEEGRALGTDVGWRGLDASLYDLGADPAEVVDLWPAPEKVVALLVREYRMALRKRYRRFASATNHEPPESPFAVSSLDFELDREVRVVHSTSPRSLGAAGIDDPWVRSDHWEFNWLHGRAGAEPIEISFALPNGRYEVSSKMQGAASVGLEGGPRAAVAAGDGNGHPEPTPLGVAKVRDERFVAEIRPDDASGVTLLWLGFRPFVGDQPVRSEAEKELVEQLKALGYVN